MVIPRFLLAAVLVFGLVSACQMFHWGYVDGPYDHMQRYDRAVEENDWESMSQNMQHGFTVGWQTKPHPLATPESVAEGKALFTQNCVMCHGENATGDGPLADKLPVKPANLKQLVHKYPGKHFYMQISFGKGETMPAWQDRFTEQQIWSITHYLFQLP